MDIYGRTESKKGEMVAPSSNVAVQLNLLAWATPRTEGGRLG